MEIFKTNLLKPKFKQKSDPAKSQKTQNKLKRVRLIKKLTTDMQ